MGLEVQKSILVKGNGDEAFRNVSSFKLGLKLQPCMVSFPMLAEMPIEIIIEKYIFFIFSVEKGVTRRTFSSITRVIFRVSPSVNTPVLHHAEYAEIGVHHRLE